jgi:4-hydroxy-2-oxoheptanedioate aldolase
VREVPLLAKLRAGEPTVGCLLAIGDGFSAETLAHCGFDWLCLDLQHGMYGVTRAIALLEALSGTDVTLLVRVPGPDPGLIGKVLDAAAMGVVLPTVESAEAARAFVAATRYAPQGRRSVGPARARLVMGSDYVAHADEGVVRLAMIETVEGLANVEPIAAVEGLHGLFVGPVDLAKSMGTQASDPGFAAALERTVGACRAQGLVPGIFVERPELLGARLDQGFTFLAVGIDAHLLEAAARASVAAFRAAAP